MIPLGVKSSSEIFWVQGSISEKTFSSRRRRVILCTRNQHHPIPDRNCMALMNDLQVCILRAAQETQFSYCILVMSPVESATYPKSSVSIVSKALWAIAPAGSEPAAIALPFLARSARFVREVPSECMYVLVGDVGDQMLL